MSKRYVYLSHWGGGVRQVRDTAELRKYLETSPHLTVQSYIPPPVSNEYRPSVKELGRTTI